MSTAGHELRATEEATAGVNIFKIVMIGVVSLVIFAFSVVAAYYVMRWQQGEVEKESGPARPNALLGKDEIGIADFVHFDADKRLAEFRQRTRAQLHGYGWVDRGQGIVRIPVDEAVRRTIAEQQGRQAEWKALSWPTAPTAPGTLETVIRSLRAGQPASAPALKGDGKPHKPEGATP